MRFSTATDAGSCCACLASAHSPVNIISFTFYGKKDDIKDIIINLQKQFFGRAVFIYKIDEIEKGSVVICKNQTCSNKINNYIEVEKYFSMNSIN